MTDVPPNAQLARQMYLEGVPVDTIVAETGLPRARLYRWIDGGPLRKGERPLPPIPRRRVAPRQFILRDERARVVSQVYTASETAVREIQMRMAQGGRSVEDCERDVKSLAALSRTLREMTAFDAMQERMAPQAGKQQKDDESDGPKDMDEFRRRLAQRIQDFIDRRRAGDAGLPRDHESGGD